MLKAFLGVGTYILLELLFGPLSVFSQERKSDKNVSKIINYLKKYYVGSIEDLEIDDYSGKEIENTGCTIVFKTEDYDLNNINSFAPKIGLRYRDGKIIIENKRVNLENFLKFLPGHLLYQIELLLKQENNTNRKEEIQKTINKLHTSAKGLFSSKEKFGYDSVYKWFEDNIKDIRVVLKNNGLETDKLIQELEQIYFIYTFYSNLYIKYEVPHEVGHHIFYMYCKDDGDKLVRLFELFKKRYSYEMHLVDEYEKYLEHRKYSVDNKEGLLKFFEQIQPSYDILAEKKINFQKLQSCMDNIVSGSNSKLVKKCFLVLSEYFAVLYSSYTVGDMEEFFEQKLKRVSLYKKLDKYGRNIQISNLPQGVKLIFSYLHWKVFLTNHLNLRQSERDFIENIVDNVPV